MGNQTGGKQYETIQIQLINNLNTFLMLQVHKFPRFAFRRCLLAKSRSEVLGRERAAEKRMRGNKKESSSRAIVLGNAKTEGK
jgi:hypothetical protein